MSSEQEGPRVTGLNLFPVKSCRAVQVEEIQLDSYGVAGDRRFMVVDGNGRFVSQRKFSVLATVTARMIDGEGGVKLMHVTAPSMAKELRFQPRVAGERVESTVWESQIKTVDQGDEPAQWFSDLIGMGTFHRLVASAESSPGFERFVANLPPSLRHKLPQMKIALADAGPVSIVSEASLADVNQRLVERVGGGEGVPLNRFRMNIEVGGCSKAFEEDEWLLIRIGSVPFLVYTNAERCKMTGIDQGTGVVDKLGPLEILRSYRAPRGPTHAQFGQLMIPLQPGGTVKLGDSVHIMDRKKT